MKKFSALIRLGGSRDHEVLRNDLTASEVEIMRVIHGLDAVVNVKAADGEFLSDTPAKPGKKAKGRTDREEKERLQMLYGPALAKLEDIRTINGVFGVGGKLPSSPADLSDADEDEDEDEDDEDNVAGFMGSPRETVQRTATASQTRDDLNNDPSNLALLRVSDTTDLGPRPVDNVSAIQQAAQRESLAATNTGVSQAVTEEAKGTVQDTETRKAADAVTKDKVEPVTPKKVGRPPAVKDEDI